MNSDTDKTIRAMGYIKATAKKATPNYYKLDDGSIIEIRYVINHLIPTGRNDEYSASVSSTMSIFVPESNRHPEKYELIDHKDLRVDPIDEDMSFEVLSEDYDIYDAGDRIVSVKPALGQIIKTRAYNIEGEPVYVIGVNPLVKMQKKR